MKKQTSHLPSATQNEINGDDAKATGSKRRHLLSSEGANMPSTPEAIRVFQDAKILYAPGKAANAGGVSVSGSGNDPELYQAELESGRSRRKAEEHHEEHPRSLCDNTVQNPMVISTM